MLCTKKKKNEKKKKKKRKPVKQINIHPEYKACFFFLLVLVYFCSWGWSWVGRRPHQTTGDLNLKSFPIHCRCRQFGSVPVPTPAPVVDLQFCLQEWVSCRVRTDLIAASGGCCWKCCLAYLFHFCFPPSPPTRINHGHGGHSEMT